MRPPGAGPESGEMLADPVRVACGDLSPDLLEPRVPVGDALPLAFCPGQVIAVIRVELLPALLHALPARMPVMFASRPRALRFVMLPARCRAE